MKQSILAPFWNAGQGRARAGWRILVQGGGYALILFGMQWLVFSRLNDAAISFAYPFSMIAASLLALWLAGRWLDRRPFADFGLHLNSAWWVDLGFGLLLGAVLMALIFAVEYAAGWVTITELWHRGSAAPFWLAMLVGLWHFVAVGINEEIISRGHMLRNLAEGLNMARIGPRWALLLAYLLSSGMFGLFHIFNPNSSWVSTLLLVAAGLFLGLGYVLTGELSIPIGLHISWNFFQGRVFGFPVSGGKAGTTLFAIQQNGPTLWTGGDFGPEAGLIGLIAILIGCGLTVLWVKGRYGKVQLEGRLAVYQLSGEQQAAAEPLPAAPRMK